MRFRWQEPRREDMEDGGWRKAFDPPLPHPQLAHWRLLFSRQLGSRSRHPPADVPGTAFIEE